MWHGVIPAVTTKFKEDGSLDHAEMERCFDYQMQAGCHGLVACGTLGEGNMLSHEERLEVLGLCKQASRDKPALLTISEPGTREACELARKAGPAGADGIMIVPSPIYHTSRDETIANLRAIAEAADLPVMIYNNPVGYKVDLSPAAFRKLASCETIVAVKESSHDSRRITDMFNACGDRYVLFCGVDDLVLENLLFGAAGWVAGLVNAFPRESVALYRLAKEGRVEEAVALYRWFMPLLHLDVDKKLVQFIKLANQIAGEGAEWVRRPRLPLVGEERERITAIVEAAIAGRPSV